MSSIGHVQKHSFICSRSTKKCRSTTLPTFLCLFFVCDHILRRLDSFFIFDGHMDQWKIEKQDKNEKRNTYHQASPRHTSTSHISSLRGFKVKHNMFSIGVVAPSATLVFFFLCPPNRVATDGAYEQTRTHFIFFFLRLSPLPSSH